MSFFFPRSVALSFICFTALAFGEEAPDQPCNRSKSYRLGIFHIESGGVGYNQGYSSLKAFIAPNPEHFSILPFADLRGHVFNDGKFAANAGIGIRTLLGCRVYGASVYYDYRNASKQHYNQVGLGFETLGIRWDFRLNGYLPVGAKTSGFYDQEATTNLSFQSFHGNNAFITEQITTSKKVQFAMKGLNAETAFHILKNQNFDLSVALGPYYYTYQSKKAVGGQARIAAQIFDYLSLELINSYDSRFHENFQGSIGVSIPLGKKQMPAKSKNFKLCSDSCLLAQRMVQSVQRQEVVVLDRFSKKTTSTTTSVAINPSTENPIFFTFVNNTSHSEGTFESPYPTLASAESNSAPHGIIYVYSGDGSSTGLDSGITLQANQKLWGSGIVQTLATTLGEVNVPALSSSHPQITNNSGNAITLSKRNEISGITIKAPQGHGIYGADAKNINILSCTIDDALNDAIHLIYNTSGKAKINSNTLSNCNGDGISITTSSNASCTGVFKKNIIEQNSGRPILGTFSGDADLTLTKNIVQQNLAGSTITFSNGGVLKAINNSFDQSLSTGAALLVTIENEPLRSLIKKNSFLNGSSTGFQVVSNASGTSCMRMRKNTSDTGYLLTNTGGTFHVTPCEVQTKNVGTITTSGVTLVNSCAVGNECP